MAPSILVVEDEPAMREVLAALLSDEDFEVQTAPDDQAALELLESDTPADVIVSDVMMPNLDGHGLIAKLRETGNGIPVILMSAAGQPQATAPAVYAIGKPFEFDSMLHLIRTLLNGHAPRSRSSAS